MASWSVVLLGTIVPGHHAMAGTRVAVFPYCALVPAQWCIGFGILTGATIVGKKEDKGIFLNAEFPHCVHNFGQAVVHGFHHLAVGFFRIVGMKVRFFRTANGGIIRSL